MGVEQLVQEQVGDLFVANQAAGVLDLLGAGTVEQVADHDGRCRNAPRFEDEGGYWCPCLRRVRRRAR